MQKDKLIDELFEAVASLTLRVNHLEQIADWQRELALQEISKMSQEQGYDDTENPLIRDDKEEIERHNKEDWSRQTMNQLNKKEETE